MSRNLLILGHGYSAAALARVLLADGWSVTGTTRSHDKAAAIAATGVTPLVWPGAPMGPALDAASHLLISAGPGPEGDPVLAGLRDQIAGATFEWVGYLSTIGVYGDHGGAWVDETTPPAPSTRRGALRVEAEAAWQALAATCDWPLQVFRIAGIYGPGRGPFAKVRAGTARRIIKEGQVFSRIHVDDIAQVLAASMSRPDPGAVYNLCDDDPAPPQDVIAHAARLLGVPVPPAIDFETADLTPMARSFYAESKRVRNEKIKKDLGVRLIYPDYRAGLQALLAAEGA